MHLVFVENGIIRVERRLGLSKYNEIVLHNCTTKGYNHSQENSKSVTISSVICRIQSDKLGTKKMVELLRQRITDSPQLKYCGEDMLGSFVIKEDRKKLKRFGAMFMSCN